MSRPSVSIGLMNGQLGIQPPSAFGNSAVLIASPIAPTAGYGVPFLITSIADAKAAFADPGNAALLNAFENGFFAEAPEGNLVYVICMAPTTPLATLLLAANAELALKFPTGINKGSIRLMAAIKYPSNTYVPTVTHGFDDDVHAAITAAQTLANSWLAKRKPFRVFVQGFACDGVPANATDYSTATNRNVFTVAAEINADSALATLQVLGRAVASASQRNIGRVKSGSLNILAAYAVTVGGLNVDSINDSVLDGYYSKRYITLEPNQEASGYIITDDNALCIVTDDYNNLAYGRVIDNAVRIAYQTYYHELKDDVDVDANGRMDTIEEKYLETAIESAIDTEIRTQLSLNSQGTAAVTCLVNPDPTDYAALYAANNIQNPNMNILQSGSIYLFLSLRPKGCLRNIYVYLGYTSN